MNFWSNLKNQQKQRTEKNNRHSYSKNLSIINIMLYYQKKKKKLFHVHPIIQLKSTYIFKKIILIIEISESIGGKL